MLMMREMVLAVQLCGVAGMARAKSADQSKEYTVRVGNVDLDRAYDYLQCPMKRVEQDFEINIDSKIWKLPQFECIDDNGQGADDCVSLRDMVTPCHKCDPKEYKRGCISFQVNTQGDIEFVESD